MNPLLQQAILVGLIRRMKEKGSWAGETHVQKASYLLSALRGVDFDFDFILYKHGPFSFELRDEVAAMQSEGLLQRVIADSRYGAQLTVSARGEELERRFSDAAQRYGPALDWIADNLGGRGVMDLERLATAMWMTDADLSGTVQARAEALVNVKRHVPLPAAIEAVEEIDRLRSASAV